MTKIQFINFKKKYEDSKLVAILSLFNKIITGGTFASYPLLLFYLFFHNRQLLPAYIILPGISFIALSLFRRVVNRPRPYEAWNTPPLIPRDKSGKSFPSRHVFSIFLIALLWYSILPALGIVFIILGFLLAIIRVITGIHYVSDVLIGALVGTLAGWLTLLFTL